jgi:hypothetical protein
MHVYEVCLRKDKRNVYLISGARHSVGCGTASRMQSATQSVGNEHVIPLCLVGLGTLAHGIEYFLRRRQEQAFQ